MAKQLSDDGVVEGVKQVDDGFADAGRDERHQVQLGGRDGDAEEDHKGGGVGGMDGLSATTSSCTHTETERQRDTHRETETETETETE